MRFHKCLMIIVTCVFIGFITHLSFAQWAPDDSCGEDLGAGAKLVVTSVAGPVEAAHNQTISVTYTVENQGDAASGAYKVRLYLSTNKKIEPAADRLLDKVTFSSGLTPGKSRKATAKVLVPINGLSGKYYYGAVVAGSKKASSKQVTLTRFTVGDNNETVTDHKTGLVWQRQDDGVQRQWTESSQYCKDLVLGGKANWRVPRIDELETIVDYTRYDHAIDAAFECRSAYYWSSNTYVFFPDYVWCVKFDSGAANTNSNTNYYHTRCVRTGP